MFERYTEKARRTIFFARYEASQFGSPCIETEHLLLGILREDKALANRFLKSSAAVEAIRKQIEQHTTIGEKVSTSVDMPLSDESEHVLAFAMEEAERLNHKHVGTDHILLGLLREEKCFASDILYERGLHLSEVRDEVAMARISRESSTDSAREPMPARVRRNLVALLLAHREQGGITVTEYAVVGSKTPEFAVYLGDAAEVAGTALQGETTESETPEAGGPEKQETPRRQMIQILARIKFIVNRMENAIANHEFEKARFYSDEERKEREALQVLMAQHNLKEEAPAPPFLCIDVVVSTDTLVILQQRMQAYFDADVACVWLIDPVGRRAYTGTCEEGLRECKGEMLRAQNVEISIQQLFK